MGARLFSLSRANDSHQLLADAFRVGRGNRQLRFIPNHPVNAHQVANERHLSFVAGYVASTVTIAWHGSLARPRMVPIEADHVQAMTANRLVQSHAGFKKAMPSE